MNVVLQLGALAVAIGYHQVANQFAKNFGPTASIANLWHD